MEVTGIRFMEVNKKPQIHYLVVNHSSAPLGSVTVSLPCAPRLEARAAAARAALVPLAVLAGFEAKEMASPIERAIGPLELPDWQDLRADVDTCSNRSLRISSPRAGLTESTTK